MMMDFKSIKHIFRDYDIRGVYGKDVNEEIMESIGNAFGQFVEGRSIVVGRDARLSSAKLSDAFISGAVQAGSDVIEIMGEVPCGSAFFWAWKKDRYLAYITGSHLPPEWNGVKFFHPSGKGFTEKENKKIGSIFIKKHIKSRPGTRAQETSRRVIERYRNYLLFRIKPEKKLKILLDCGNGTAGVVVKDLFIRAGFDTDAIFETPDGTFPNRKSDPSEDPLNKLREEVKNYDFGIAYDGDADRIAVIDEKGTKLMPEHVSSIILEELTKTEKGPIIANIECTRFMDSIAQKFGRKLYRIPVGHTYMVREALKRNACLCVEASRHFCIPSILPFDDAIPASLYFAVALSKKDEKLSDIVSKMPQYYIERTNLDCLDEIKFRVVEKLKKTLSRKYRNTSTIDGIAIDFPKSRVLIRASNTSPMIRITVESETQEDFATLKQKFADMLKEEIRKAEKKSRIRVLSEKK